MALHSLVSEEVISESPKSVNWLQNTFVTAFMGCKMRTFKEVPYL